MLVPKSAVVLLEFVSYFFVPLFPFTCFLWVTWTVFRISSWFTYNILECYLCMVFLEVALDIKMYICGLSQFPCINILKLQVKYGNLPFIYIPFPSPHFNTIALSIRWCNFCFLQQIWFMKLRGGWFIVCTLFSALFVFLFGWSKMPSFIILFLFEEIKDQQVLKIIKGRDHIFCIFVISAMNSEPAT